MSISRKREEEEKKQEKGEGLEERGSEKRQEKT
jgi:hypothetical protein